MSRTLSVLIIGLIAICAYVLGASQQDLRLKPTQSLPLQSTAQTFIAKSPQSSQANLPTKDASTLQAKARSSIAAETSTDPSRTKPQTKEKAAAVLTAAAIAALIVAASRQAYYAKGRPCACPDDRMRNGRSCGSRSAYSKPGGAQPLCYSHDVTPQMIEAYRSRIAQR